MGSVAGTGIYYGEIYIYQAAFLDVKIKNQDVEGVLVTVLVGEERNEGSMQNEINQCPLELLCEALRFLKRPLC